MELDPRLCYRALSTRDQRFDGRFFTGVLSTGVYCRPVCPARTPRADRCRFFACAAAAEAAGFRPCLRCRPEAAPGSPAWRGTSATVARALKLIEEGALDQGSVEALAARLGVGDRHLRRLFTEQLGATPMAVAQTRRVHFAKRLIEGTALPMTQVAYSAGFPNVRRFNAAFKSAFDRTPTEIRRRAGRSARALEEGGLSLRLPYREPFDWEGLLGFLAPRAIPGVEVIEGGVYRRAVDFGGAFQGVIELAPDPDAQRALRLRVPGEAAGCLAQVTDRARQLMDLDADPVAIFDQLSGDARLGVVEGECGLRVPGAWDRLELATRVILGQQVTVAAATTLAGRLVRAYGRELPGAGAEPSWIFPSAEALAEADLEALGMPKTRALAIGHLARAVRDGSPMLELASGLDEAIARLVTLPGVGDWTAQVIAMRALREPDAFPAGDLVLRRTLATTGGPALGAAQLRHIAEPWRPFRAYAAMLLWRRSATATGRESSR